MKMQALIMHRRVPIADVPVLSDADLVPRAGTPLIDAVCIAINIAKQDFADQDRVVMTVMTDGAENSSKEFSLAQLRDLIKERSAAGWDFVFLGAEIDAYADARRFGLDVGATMSYAASALGESRAAYKSVARRAKSYTGAREGFSDAEKRAAGDSFVPNEGNSYVATRRPR